MKKNMSVLIVEDSVYAADVNVRYLKKAGLEVNYQVVAAPNAMRTALASQKWDVILSDNYMPGFSLQQALAIRNELADDVPFIIVSELVTEKDAAEAFKNKANCYVPKQHLSDLAAQVIEVVSSECRVNFLPEREEKL